MLSRIAISFQYQPIKMDFRDFLETQGVYRTTEHVGMLDSVHITLEYRWKLNVLAIFRSTCSDALETVENTL